MFVIGVAGQAQFGKDTLADRLAEKLNEAGTNWNRTAFAKNVKRVYAETFNVDYDFIEKWKTEAEPPPDFDMTVRKSLQFIGDGFRKIKTEIWIDLCFRDQSPQIISDVRYPNEFRRVDKEGGLNILVGRPDKLSDDPNGSEALIRPYVEWFLNNTEGDVVDCNTLCFHDSPEDASMFDLFVRNEKSKEDFITMVDEKVVPFVQKFVFKFPIEEEEKSCHTLS